MNYLCLYGVAHYSFKSFDTIICACVTHYSFKSFDTIICGCMVWHITVLKVSIQLFVPVWHITVLKVSIQLFVAVWCGTLQFIKFDTIICACLFINIMLNWHFIKMLLTTNIYCLSFFVRCLVLERTELKLCLTTHYCWYSLLKGS